MNIGQEQTLGRYIFMVVPTISINGIFIPPSRRYARVSPEIILLYLRVLLVNTDSRYVRSDAPYLVYVPMYLHTPTIEPNMSKSTQDRHSVTIVGSRDTPSDKADLLAAIATYTANMGWFVRSGHSGKADLAAERGVLVSNHPDNIELYLPCVDFGDPVDNVDRCVAANKLDNYQDAIEIAKSIISPAHWANLDYFGQQLHSRNPYQVLGLELNDPSKLLFCYAKPVGAGRVKGGTNTAVQVARQHRVPVLNVYHDHISDFIRHAMIKSPA